MNAGPEQFTATKYFTDGSIVERLEHLACSFRWYLGEDSLPYLVYKNQDDKRQAFKDFILSEDHSDFAIDTILDCITEAEFLQKQRNIEYAIHRQDELLTRYTEGGSQSDNDSTDEESYW